MKRSKEVTKKQNTLSQELQELKRNEQALERAIEEIQSDLSKRDVEWLQLCYLSKCHREKQNPKEEPINEIVDFENVAAINDTAIDLAVPVNKTGAGRSDEEFDTSDEEM